MVLIIWLMFTSIFSIYSLSTVRYNLEAFLNLGIIIFYSRDFKEEISGDPDNR
jgi:hypothetical protein